jgi:hypothetical protein
VRPHTILLSRGVDGAISAVERRAIRAHIRAARLVPRFEARAAEGDGGAPGGAAAHSRRAVLTPVRIAPISTDRRQLRSIARLLAVSVAAGKPH